MSTRRKYTKAFKLDAISLVTEQRYSCTEAAKSLGINSNMLNRWLRESSEDAEEAFRGNSKLTNTAVTGRSQTPEHGKRHIKKGDGLLCESSEIKYLFIAPNVPATGHYCIWIL